MRKCSVNGIKLKNKQKKTTLSESELKKIENDENSKGWYNFIEVWNEYCFAKKQQFAYHNHDS